MAAARQLDALRGPALARRGTDRCCGIWLDSFWLRGRWHTLPALGVRLVVALENQGRERHRHGVSLGLVAAGDAGAW